MAGAKRLLFREVNNFRDELLLCIAPQVESGDALLKMVESLLKEFIGWCPVQIDDSVFGALQEAFEHITKIQSGIICVGNPFETLDNYFVSTL